MGIITRQSAAISRAAQCPAFHFDGKQFPPVLYHEVHLMVALPPVVKLVVGFMGMVEQVRTGKRELSLVSMWKYPTAVDAAVAGTLNAATYTTDLVTALDAAHLGAHHAAVFTASGGDLTGHSFLVVDVNGVAGYQLAGDLLVDITGAANLGSFGIGDFI